MVSTKFGDGNIDMAAMAIHKKRPLENPQNLLLMDKTDWITT